MTDETNRLGDPEPSGGGESTNGGTANPAGLPGATGPTGTWEPPTVEQAEALFPGYELLELIARGGMGAVYLARQVSLDRLVAIKLLPLEVSMVPGFADNFRREARLMARLQHPNIVAVFDFGQTVGGHLFIVMEYVDGTNLFEMIHGDGLDAETALAVVAHVCLALDYAHEKGIVHRDIKPANVMIETTGHVKVADFGLARLVEPGADMASAVTQMAMGTPDYAAPEQAEGLPVDRRADIYALGVVLYEMLCRKVPKGVFQPPSARIGCDVRIDAIVTKAMQQQPEMRYHTAAQMKADVELALTPTSPRKPDPRMMPEPDPKPAQRGPAAVAGNRPPAHAAAPGPRRAVVPVASAKFSLMSILISLGIGAAALFAVHVAIQPKTPPSPMPPAVQTVADKPDQRGMAKPTPNSSALASTDRPRPVVPPQRDPRGRTPDGLLDAPFAPPQPIPHTSTTPPPSAAALNPKPLNPTAQWLAEQEPKWQESFKREVSGPFDKGVAEIKKQFLAGIDAQLAAAASSGQLDVAVALRDEKQRGGEVPSEDVLATLPAIKGLRANYRRSFDLLATTREAAARNFTATYDAVLSKQQELLTKARRFDEALELKTKREQFAAGWLSFNGSSRIYAAAKSRTETKSEEPDPVIGIWKWSNSEKPMTLSGKGIAENGARVGKWVCLYQSSVFRKYQITWSTDQYVDTLTLLRDGKELSGENQAHAKLSLTRLTGAPADAQRFNGKLYRLYEENLSWTKAREKCGLLGGQLVVIKDAATQEFIKTLTNGGRDIWLGATDEKVEGQWVWVDGSPMDFTAWRRGEPNNWGGPENYLGMSKNGGGWADGPDYLDYNTGYVREWPDRGNGPGRPTSTPGANYRNPLNEPARQVPYRVPYYR